MISRLFLYFILFVSLPAHGQFFEQALEKYTATSGSRIYIHYDQQEYVPGETIWFKAFVMQDQKPLAGNTNLYLRLLSPEGREIARRFYPVAGAVSSGDIELPDSLRNAVYELQVMTTGMLAAGKYQSVLIPVSRTSRMKPSDLQVGFFPEGGSLIAGIPNRVTFYAEMNGVPTPVKGRVREKGSRSAQEIASYLPGLGAFEMLPVAGKEYEAEVEWPGGNKIILLPPVVKSGIQLRVEDEKEGKSFQLTRVASSPTENAVVFVVAEINGHVVYEQEVAFEDYPSVKGHLLTAELPSGVLHFTVFDAKNNILADRLSFIDNGEYRLPANISVSKITSSPRSKQEVEIVLPGAEEFSGSVAIVQGSPLSRDHIISRFLLSSKLKRPVWRAGWYFIPGNDSAKLGLDLLLRTQELSEFDWKQVLASQILPVETLPEMISISGKVTDEYHKEKLGPGRLNFYIEAQDSTSFNREAAVDEQGNFRLDGMEFRGRAKLFYTFTDRNEKILSSARLILDRGKAEQKLEKLSIQTYNQMEFEAGTDPQLAMRIDQVKNHDEQIRILEKVTLNAKKKKRPTEVLEDKYATGVFRMQASKTLDNINEPSRDETMNVVDYIRNRINEVELTGRGFVNRKTISMGSGTRWAVGIFLDESPTDIGILRSIRVADVAMVKFFDVGWVGVGTAYPGGAVAVWTKKDEEKAPASLKLEHVIVDGYSPAKEFTHIDYSQKDLRQSARDHRFTLYWNPGLLMTRGNGKFKFSYYTNDQPKIPKTVIVQGFDPDGRLVYAEKQLD